MSTMHVHFKTNELWELNVSRSWLDPKEGCRGQLGHTVH